MRSLDYYQSIIDEANKPVEEIEQPRERQTLAGDYVDAFQAGVLGTTSALARGVTLGSANPVSQYLDEKTQEQYETMNPESREAMEGFGFEDDLSLKDSSSWKGFGLAAAQGAGSFVPSMAAGYGAGAAIGAATRGGVLAKSLAASRAARTALPAAQKAERIAAGQAARTAVVQKAAERASIAGYGGAGAAMIGGSTAQSVSEDIMNQPPEVLFQSDDFKNRYREFRNKHGEQEAFDLARDDYANSKAMKAFPGGAAVGAVSMGIGGPIMEKVIKGKFGNGRLANGLVGFLTEAPQEFFEEGFEKLLANVAAKDYDKNRETMSGVIGSAATGAAIGGVTGGGLGIATGRTQPSSKKPKWEKPAFEIIPQEEEITFPNGAKIPYGDVEAYARYKIEQGKSYDLMSPDEIALSRAQTEEDIQSAALSFIAAYNGKSKAVDEVWSKLEQDGSESVKTETQLPAQDTAGLPQPDITTSDLGSASEQDVVRAGQDPAAEALNVITQETARPDQSAGRSGDVSLPVARGTRGKPKSGSVARPIEQTLPDAGREILAGDRQSSDALANPILTQTKANYLKQELKNQQINPKSPGYADARKRIANEYESDLNKALAGLTLAQFSQHPANKEASPELNRQAWESLRDQYGITDETTEQSGDTKTADLPSEGTVTDSSIEASPAPQTKSKFAERLATRGAATDDNGDSYKVVAGPNDDGYLLEITDSEGNRTTIGNPRSPWGLTEAHQKAVERGFFSDEQAKTQKDQPVQPNARADQAGYGQVVESGTERSEVSWNEYESQKGVKVAINEDGYVGKKPVFETTAQAKAYDDAVDEYYYNLPQKQLDRLYEKATSKVQQDLVRKAITRKFSDSTPEGQAKIAREAENQRKTDAIVKSLSTKESYSAKEIDKVADKYGLTASQISEYVTKASVIKGSNKEIRYFLRDSLKKKDLKPQDQTNDQSQNQTQKAKQQEAKEEVSKDSGSQNTDKPISGSQKAKSEQQKQRKTGITDKNDLLAAIAKLGGISAKEARAQGIDSAAFKTRGHGIKRIFHNGKTARSFDAMAEALRGYEFDTQGANDLLDKVSRAINQGENIYNDTGYEYAAEIMAQEKLAEQEAYSVMMRESLYENAAAFDKEFGTSMLKTIMSIDDLSLDAVKEWEIDLNEERDSRRKQAIDGDSEASILGEYTETEVRQREAEAKRREQERLKAEQQADRKEKADKDVDNIVDEMLGTEPSTNDVFGQDSAADKIKADKEASKPEATQTKQQAKKAEVADEVKTGEAKAIEDFGEKLGGSRKDKAQSQNRISEFSDDEIANLPLSKIWPKDSIEKIEDKSLAAIAHAFREVIPTKPQSSYKKKAWVEKVKTMKGFFDSIANSEEGQAITKEKVFNEMGQVATLVPVLHKIKLLENLEREQWGRVGEVRIVRTPSFYNKRVSETGMPGSQVTIDKRVETFLNITDINELAKAVNDAINSNPVGEKGGTLKFEIRTNYHSGVTFINKKGDSEYRHLKEFKSVEDARDYLKNNYADLAKSWEAVKERDNIKKTDVRRKENRPRTAQDWRKGKDVTVEQFQETFGFRGAEFGNWVSQGKNAKERQGMLNFAYDALMDLSNILEIPTQAISLDGSLGIGFGSRGSGAAAAHFEPDRVVINLTKTKGAGALAHEWFHALDNYFSRMRGGEFKSTSGETYRKENFVTYKPERLYVDKEYPTSRFTKKQLDIYAKTRGGRFARSELWIPDPKHKEGVRPVVEKAFADLVNALNESPMAKRALTIDRGKPEGYWSQIIERGARSFENYVIAKMAEQGYHNDYLANVTPYNEFARNPDRYPYLLENELKPIVDAFDNLFKTMETRETDKGVALFSKAKKPISSDVTFGEFETGKPVTFDFAHNTESATDLFGKPKKGDRFKRDLEPSGRYVIQVPDASEVDTSRNTISGTLTFNNPLVLNVETWKEDLQRHYKKRGKALSNALIADGFDGVVTIDGKYGTSEILDLTTFDEAKAKYSRSDTSTNTHTTQSLTDAIRRVMDKAYGDGWFDRLQATGKFQIDESHNDPGVQAFYDPKTDVSHIVSGNISQNATGAEIRGLLLHEVSTHALRLGKDDARFQAILKQVEALSKTNEAVKQAAARVPADTPAHLRSEETLGYLVEQNADLPVVKRFLAWFRNAIRTLGDTLTGVKKLQFHRWASQLNDADLVYMAQSALRKAPDSLVFDGNIIPLSQRFNKTSSDPRYSKRDPFDYPTKQDPIYAEIGKAARDQFEQLTDRFRTGHYGAYSARQLVTMSRDKLPIMQNFMEAIQGRESVQGNYKRLADKLFVDHWEKLSKQDNERLSYLMNESTLADIDASIPWSGKDGSMVYTQGQLDKHIETGLLESAKNIDANAKLVGDGKFQFSNEASANQFWEIAKFPLKKTEGDAKFSQWKKRNAQFKSLPSDAQTVYTEANKLHRNLFDARINALANRINDKVLNGKQAAALVDAIRLNFEKAALNWYYAPLSRFGDYWIYSNQNGEPYFEAFETQNQQNRKLAEYADKDYEIIGSGKKLENMSQIQGVDEGFVAQVQTVLAENVDPNQAADIQDQIYQMYLSTLPEVSMRKHSMHRKGTAGYHEDASRAFAHSQYHGARQLSGMENNGIMLDTLEAAREVIAISDSTKKRQQVETEREALEMLSEEWDTLDVETLEENIEARPDDPVYKEMLKFRKQFEQADNVDDILAREVRKRSEMLRMSDNLGKDTRRMTDTVAELQKSYQAMTQPTHTALDSFVQKLNSLNFMGMLGFGVSSGLINMTSTPMVAVPLSIGRFKGLSAKDVGSEFMSVSSSLVKAMAQGIKDVDGNLSFEPMLSGDEKRAFQIFTESMDRSTTMGYHLIGVSDEGFSHGGPIEKLKRMSAWWFHHTERVNRDVTLLAAYRLGRKSGMNHDAAIATAREIMYDSQGDYSKDNRFRFGRGPLGAMAMQFKIYQQNLYFQYGRAFLGTLEYMRGNKEKRDAARTFASLMAMQTAFAGALSYPASGALMMMLDMIGGAFDDPDDPWDTEKEIKLGLIDVGKAAGMSDSAAKTFSHAITKGAVNAFLGMDFNSRLELSSIMFRKPIRELEGSDEATRLLASIFGPTGGTVQNFFQAAKLMGDGEVWRGAERAIPKSVRDILQAIRFANEDARSIRGDVIKEISAAEAIMKGIGIAPSQLSLTYDERTIQKNTEQAILDTRKKLMTMLITANKKGDEKMKSKVADKIEAFNQRNPSVPITFQSIIQSIKSRDRISSEMTAGTYINPKLSHVRNQTLR